MYDINKLRKELKSNPKQLELLNELHAQIVKHHYSYCITIELSEKNKFSSKLKKSTVNLLGYKVSGKKISNTFEITRR